MGGAVGILHWILWIIEDLMILIKQSRANGRMLATFTETFIALICKTNNLISFEELEPSSLCNCIYKIIAKVIA